MTNILSAEQLYKLLENNSNIIILDASIEGQKAKQRYLQEHIKETIFFDIDEFSEQKSSLARMLPKPQQLADQIANMGISKDDHIVVYDQRGMFSAARGWWMLKIIGAKNVKVLDGGLPMWKKLNYPLKSGIEKSKPPREFIADFNTNMIKNAEQVHQASKNKQKIIDARDPFRFRGEDVNGKQRSGRIPNSINLHFPELLNAENKFLPIDELKRKIPIKDNENIITTCGSGVTACVLALAIDEIGHKNYAVYDGAWAEWGMREDLPIETG